MTLRVEKWFAWYPVFSQVDNVRVWLKLIWRRRINKYGLTWWEYSLNEPTKGKDFTE